MIYAGDENERMYNGYNTISFVANDKDAPLEEKQKELN